MKTFIYLAIFLLPITSWANRATIKGGLKTKQIQEKPVEIKPELGAATALAVDPKLEVEFESLPIETKELNQTAEESIGVPTKTAVSKVQVDGVEAIDEVLVVDEKASVPVSNPEDGKLVLKKSVKKASAPAIAPVVQQEKVKASADAKEVKAPVEKASTAKDVSVPDEEVAIAENDSDVIQKILRENAPQFQGCYQKELDVNNNPNALKGIVNFRFFIESEGKVIRAEITSKEISSSRLNDCMKSVLNKIHFPSPHRGKAVEVLQPMNFSPKKYETKKIIELKDESALAKTLTLSPVDPSEIKRLLREHVPQFRSCYQKELDVNKTPESFKGSVGLMFFIANEGKVSRSKITLNKINSNKVHDCMKNVLDGIKFPSPKGGGTVEVSQNMNLYSKRI